MAILSRAHANLFFDLATEQSEASVQHLDARMTPDALTLNPVLRSMNSLDNVSPRQCHHQGRQQDTNDQSPSMTLLDDLVL